MKIRIRFGKQGMVKFIGHLDIMRYFQKAFRRADFDLKYSQGYHPHPILSFASPLGVGLESTGEYMDLEVDSITGFAQMKDKLSEQMADGITVLDIRELPDQAKNAMSLVAAADYQIRFREGMAPCTYDALTHAVTDFMAQETITVLKKTKKSEKEMDIRSLIYGMNVDTDGSIRMQVSAGSAANLKPELVMQTLCEKENLPCNPYAWMTTRCDMYADAGDTNTGRKLVSLSVYEG